MKILFVVGLLVISYITVAQNTKMYDVLSVSDTLIEVQDTKWYSDAKGDCKAKDDFILTGWYFKFIDFFKFDTVKQNISINYFNCKDQLYRRTEFIYLKQEILDYKFAKNDTILEIISKNDSCTSYIEINEKGDSISKRLECFKDSENYYRISFTLNNEYFYNSQDSNIYIKYYPNGMIDYKSITKDDTETIQYFNETGNYLGTQYWIKEGENRIRYDISLEGDTTKPLGWTRLNPITLEYEYVENK